MGLPLASYDYVLGTTITVTNPHNGRTCQVRVNDHGPNGLARVMGARIDFAFGARDCFGMVASQYVCAPAPHLSHPAEFHEKKSATHVTKRNTSIMRTRSTGRKSRPNINGRTLRTKSRLCS